MVWKHDVMSLCIPYQKESWMKEMNLRRDQVDAERRRIGEMKKLQAWNKINYDDNYHWELLDRNPF